MVKEYEIDRETGLRMLVNQRRRKIYLVSEKEWREHRNDPDDKEMVLDMPHEAWLKLLVKELLNSKNGFFRWLLNDVVKRGYTFVIVFVGDKQSGKTVAAIQVAELFNFLAEIDIPLSDVYNLSAADLFEKINEKVKGRPEEYLRSGATLVLDESSVELNPTGHHVEDETADLIKAFSVYGDAKVNICTTEPELRIMSNLKGLITKVIRMGIAGAKFGHYGRRGWGLLKKVEIDDNKKTPRIWSERIGIKFIPLDLSTYNAYRPLKTFGVHRIAEESITRMRARREKQARRLKKIRAQMEAKARRK